MTTRLHRYPGDRRLPTRRDRFAARFGRVRGWRLLALLGVATLVVAALAYIAYPSSPARPQGEVLARVEGVPITGTDVETEARAAGIASGAIDPATRQALLRHVVDRRLLVAAAHKQGIDANPVFRLDRARADEMALAGVIAGRFAQTDKPIDDAAARRYMAAHPAMFAGRATLVLDAITTDGDGLSEAAIRGLNTMADAVQLLRSTRQPMVRATRKLDSATLPPDLLARLDALKPGEVFVMPQGRAALIGVITDRVANPPSDAEGLAAARAGAERQRARAAVDAALTALRKTMRVTYPATATH